MKFGYISASVVQRVEESTIVLMTMRTRDRDPYVSYSMLL